MIVNSTRYVLYSNQTLVFMIINNTFYTVRPLNSETKKFNAIFSSRTPSPLM